MWQPPPNDTDYLTFLRNVVGVPETALPDNSSMVDLTLQTALLIANLDVAQAAPLVYVLMVYNLAGDLLINYAPDQLNQSYFQQLRDKFKIASGANGIVASVSDNGTSSTLLNPEQMQALTLSDLQNLKTPYGRQYLAFAQKYGQTLWGVS